MGTWAKRNNGRFQGKAIYTNPQGLRKGEVSIRISALGAI